MDVVKTNIEELRGSVEVKTKEGEGTLIRIKLPLTLAIIEGMLVRIGRSVLIIPLLSVIETIQVSRENYKTVEGKGEVILVRGDYS
jgi:two-component system chemotaxis sensor kinase CheA